MAKKIKVLPDKTAPATRDAAYTFPVFKTFYLRLLWLPRILFSKGLFFSRSSITSGNSERDKSKYRSRLCAVLAALHTPHCWLLRRRGDRDGSMEPLFVPLCPGMQVSPSDGEGSGKHLYLKSTLSTVPLSERS